MRPSILISRIKKIYKQLEEKSDILTTNTEILTANVTFENLLENIKEVNEGKKIDDIWFDIYNFYKNNEEWKYKLQASVNGMEYNNNPEIIREDLIQKMYGNTLKTSVSKLETYKKCPFSFHLKYGLNVQDQKQFKLEALDTGSFMHDIIDSFFNTLIEKQIKPKELEDSKLKEIIEKIYVFRYYKLIPINKTEEIKDIKNLKTEIKRTEKYLITKACNLRAINILCNNVEKNYEITSDILKYRIIDLEDMLLEAQKNNDKFILKVYDDNAIAGILQYETNEDFNIKLNKKTKLFI